MTQLSISPESQLRLAKIAAYVKERLEADAARYQVDRPWLDYRWRHTLRVANIGYQLALAEKASLDLCVAGCLLHDIASFRPEDPQDLYSHGRVGAQLIRPELPDLGYSPEEVDNICYSVAVHADGMAGYNFPHTIEAKVVSDADNIDRFDAYRLLEYCQPHMHDFEKLVAAASQRLTRLETYRGQRIMETDHGHKLFNQKLDMQIMVYKALIEQHRISSLDTLPGFSAEGE